MYLGSISTERLSTRALTQKDIADWSSFFKDPNAVKFLGLNQNSFPDNIAQSTAWINKQLDRYANGHFGLQALIDKKTKELIGQCGLLTQTLDDVAELEIGYHIFSKYWGQGYATEAAKAFKDYAFAHTTTNSVISIIDINNIASQKVALKNGMKKEKQTLYYSLHVFIYRISRE